MHTPSKAELGPIFDNYSGVVGEIYAGLQRRGTGRIPSGSSPRLHRAPANSGVRRSGSQQAC